MLAVLMLLLQCDNAHATSFGSYSKQSLFTIWGNDCQLPYDAERNCSESSNEADASGKPLPPPQTFEPCPDGYSCRCCFSRKDCAPDQGQCAVRQRTCSRSPFVVGLGTLQLSGWVSTSWVGVQRVHVPALTRGVGFGVSSRAATRASTAPRVPSTSTAMWMPLTALRARSARPPTR